jgi:DNA-binding NarL/FixJ family response regulator
LKKTRILLADDHQFITEGLKNILEPKHEVIGTVEDGKKLVRQAIKLQPDILVVDISMPILNGFEAFEQLKKEGVKSKVIFLTMHPDVAYAARALDMGASGYILKHSAPEELLLAIDKALLGGTFLTPKIEVEINNSNHTTKSPLRKLTSRQREVLQLLAEGNSAKKIAKILFVSPRTAEFHKYRIMEELGIKTNAELVQYAIKHGIVSI